MSHIISVFIPQEECPFNCIFCNQDIAVGTVKSLKPHEIAKQVEMGLSTLKGKKCQVAFYGGSFTALPSNTRIEYLETVQPYVKRGMVDGIRISTRPDMLDADIIDEFKKYRVNTVELGVQVMDDEILKILDRGHTENNVILAVSMLRSASISTGLQLMVGLPGETRNSLVNSWKKVISLKPDFIRIHPTIVLRDTILEKLYLKGEYEPLSLDNAVCYCAVFTIDAEKNCIKVIRTGLQSSASLQKEGSIVAGPWHPSFGQMVKARIYYLIIIDVFQKYVIDSGKVEIVINKKEMSNFKGLKNINLKKLKAEFPSIEIVVNTSDEMERFQLQLVFNHNEYCIDLSIIDDPLKYL